MSFISSVRIEGHVSRIDRKTSQAGNDYIILRIAGEDEADCEVAVFGFTVADCQDITEGDYVVVMGEINVRKREGSQGGTFLNLQVIVRNIRRITLLPIDATSKTEQPEQATSTEDESDLPF